MAVRRCRWSPRKHYNGADDHIKYVSDSREHAQFTQPCGRYSFVFVRILFILLPVSLPTYSSSSLPFPPIYLPSLLADITKGVVQAQQVHLDAYARYVKFEKERQAALEVLRKQEQERLARLAEDSDGDG